MFSPNLSVESLSVSSYERVLQENLSTTSFWWSFNFIFGKRSFSALVLLVLGVLVRQDALEEGAEYLFTKLRALVCQVCVNQFLLLIVLVLELARGHVHLHEGGVGRAQNGAIIIFSNLPQHFV